MYIKQTNVTNCGPVAIFNVFRHFSMPSPSLKEIARDTGWKKGDGTSVKSIRKYLRKYFTASYNRFTKSSLDSLIFKKKVVILFFTRTNKFRHLMLIVGRTEKGYIAVNYKGFKKGKTIRILSKDLIDSFLAQHMFSIVVDKKI